LEHRIHGDAVPACNIEDLAPNTRHLAREQIRFNHILHVSEITRLKTVAVDRRSSILKNSRNEERQDPPVLRRSILSRTEHIEVSKRDCLKSIRLRENLRIDLTKQLLCTVR